MKIFKGFRSRHEISGSDKDAYYNTLPDHDLGALSNYFYRLSKAVECKSIIDVGANIGLSALLMSEICPAAHIHAFEPTPSTYDTLIQNISNNLASEFITPVRLALADREGTVKFTVNASNSSGNSISSHENGCDVEVTTIDNFVRSQQIKSVEFIKIDVEGYERSVIDGASDTIFRFRPVIMLEFNEYALRVNAGANPVEALAAIMASIGQLGIVNALNGEATALPANPEDAYRAIKSVAKSEFDVLDLVTQHF